MRSVFDIDGPVMSVVIRIFDCICLSVLWLVFSLPIITVGASSTALYVTVHRYLRRGEGHPLRTFLDAFRDNFKRSTLVWLAALCVLDLLTADILVLRTMVLNRHPLGRLYWLALILGGVAVTWTAYCFAYAARFQGRARDVLRSSLFLTLAHPVRALGVFLILFAAALAVMTGPGLIAIIPTAVCWLESAVMENVFLLHMRPEDAERETHNHQAKEHHCEE